MISKAIPEGVLEGGGRISGFLYFAQIEPVSTPVTFVVQLVDANTGEQFGTLEIPLRVERKGRAVSLRPVERPALGAR